MLYINGEWREAASGATFESRNPATGEVIDSVADAGVDDVRAAVDAAAAAFEPWSTRTAYERSAYLYQAHQLMLERREALAKLMTEEQGKPIRMARNEVGYAADFLLWFAEEAKRVYGETIPSARADQRFLVLRQPVGVVGAITPWNYPVSMLTRKIAPALAAGCTIVIKPAEQTPLLAVEVFKIFDEIGLPEGVVNLVTTSDPGAGRRRAGHQPEGAQDHLHRLDRGRQADRATGGGAGEAGQHGARRPRAVHRARRRRPGARGQGRGGGEVPQHRPGVHLPEPPLRPARARRAVRRHARAALPGAEGRAAGSSTASPSAR